MALLCVGDPDVCGMAGRVAVQHRPTSNRKYALAMAVIRLVACLILLSALSCKRNDAAQPTKPVESVAHDHVAMIRLMAMVLESNGHVRDGLVYKRDGGRFVVEWYLSPSGGCQLKVQSNSERFGDALIGEARKVWASRSILKGCPSGLYEAGSDALAEAFDAWDSSRPTEPREYGLAHVFEAVEASEHYHVKATIRDCPCEGWAAGDTNWSRLTIEFDQLAVRR